MAEGFTVGLDVGGTKIHGVLSNPQSQVIAEARVPTEPGVPAIVEAIDGLVHDLVAQAGLKITDLYAVGVGVPGLVESVSGTVRHAVNLGIDNDQPVPLAAMLWSRLGLPVALDNDLNVAALGAAHLMPAFGGHSNDLAFLSLGTGLAAGIVLGGIIRRGGGAAGEIGHIPVAPGGIACPCGQRGCLEQYASGAALDRMWPGPGDVPPPQDLFAQAASGNPKAIAVRDRYADAVALAVQMIALTIDVRWIVIGGGVASVGDPLLDAVRRALTRVADRSPFLASLDLEARVQLAPATLPIAAVGASLLALARW